MCKRQYREQFLLLKDRPVNAKIINVDTVEASVDLLIVESGVLLDARYLEELDIKKRVPGFEFAHNRPYRSVKCRRNKTDPEFALFALDGIGNAQALDPLTLPKLDQRFPVGDSDRGRGAAERRLPSLSRSTLCAGLSSPNRPWDRPTAPPRRSSACRTALREATAPRTLPYRPPSPCPHGSRASAIETFEWPSSGAMNLSSATPHGICGHRRDGGKDLRRPYPIDCRSPDGFLRSQGPDSQQHENGQTGDGGGDIADV